MRFRVSNNLKISTFIQIPYDIGRQLLVSSSCHLTNSDALYVTREDWLNARSLFYKHGYGNFNIAWIINHMFDKV